MKNKIFYHGTPLESRGQNIILDGIKPDLSTTEGLARPVDGHVYLSINLRYALIYLLGGDILGSALPKSWMEESRYGYLFEIAGTELGEINPDEDQIGQAISELKFDWTHKYKEFLQDQEPLPLELDEEMNDFYSNLWEQVKSGDYVSWIKAGHLLLPRLTDNEKNEVIAVYGNVANRGIVRPIAAWKFDKLKCCLLKTDGSNFFELADKVI
jgi:hypothetical protein